GPCGACGETLVAGLGTRARAWGSLNVHAFPMLARGTLFFPRCSALARCLGNVTEGYHCRGPARDARTQQLGARKRGAVTAAIRHHPGWARTGARRGARRDVRRALQL